MEITVLGKYGPFPAPGGACSGYLIKEKDTNILLESGSGVISRLQQIVDIENLDAVVISHLHGDHMADMIILRYLIQLRTKKCRYGELRLPVYLPNQPKDIFESIKDETCFNVIPIDENSKLQIGDLSIDFDKACHPVPSYSMKIKSDDKTLVYTADTCWHDDIVDFCSDADLLVAETGMLESERDGNTVHLTACEVGLLAKDTNAKQLLATHFYPDTSEKDIKNEIIENYPDVIMAQEMKT